MPQVGPFTALFVKVSAKGAERFFAAGRLNFSALDFAEKLVCIAPLIAARLIPFNIIKPFLFPK